LDRAISDELIAFNQALSTYISDSEISRLNQTGKHEYESRFFYPVLKTSKEVYEQTQGAFDPTIGPLVKAWGFGPDKSIPNLGETKIDSLRAIVGFSRVVFDEDKVVLPPNFQLDFSAIAKGYAVDVIAQMLEEKGIDRYLVEIGGEVRCKGQNDQDKPWAVGIEDPTVTTLEQRVMAIVRLKDRSLATSGNYRNYYEREGKIYAHIIDPRTGYTATHNLLSASVFADDCMTADAYATAFMVLGLQQSKEIIERNNLDAILLYSTNNGVESFVSEGIQPFLEMNKALRN
jgi:thiamine biosynthesis lipoprotein